MSTPVNVHAVKACKFWGLSQDLRGPKTWVEYIAHGFTQTVGGTKAGHVTDALDPPMLRVVSPALGGWNQRDFPNWDAGRCPSSASKTVLINLKTAECCFIPFSIFLLPYSLAVEKPPIRHLKRSEVGDAASLAAAPPSQTTDHLSHRVSLGDTSLLPTKWRVRGGPAAAAGVTMGPASYMSWSYPRKTAAPISTFSSSGRRTT
ncbi:hypothetical protein C8F01DRAFT_1088603 [Mycena amicta]|nr:hypothetical protein C8F01DRAFT_1088603 [Mycena amicta]